MLTDDGEQTPIGARGWYSSAVLLILFTSGHPLILHDLFQSIMFHQKNWTNNPSTTPMTAASTTTIDQKTRVVLTDYDEDCLLQLQTNTCGVQQRLEQHYYSNSSSKNIETTPDDDDDDDDNNGTTTHDPTSFLPDLCVEKLDWNEYDQYQPLLEIDETNNKNTNTSTKKPMVTLVCGAALVYCDDTVSCADQVWKILQ